MSKRFSLKKWLVVRRKENNPIRVVAGENVLGQRRESRKKTDELNRAYRGSDVKFMVRERDWRRKRSWS